MVREMTLFTMYMYGCNENVRQESLDRKKAKIIDA